MSGATPAANAVAIRERLDGWVTAYLPVLLALHFEPGDLPTEIAPQAVSASMGGLVDLCERDLTGAEPVPEPPRRALQRYYGRLVKGEDLARQHLGLTPAKQPAPDPALSQILATMTAVQQQGEATAPELRTLRAAQDPKVGPLFSAAADRYHDEMAGTRGAHHDEPRYVRHRKAVFIAICGDRPVTAYTAADMQLFMDKARFLAPNLGKQPGHDIAHALDYIAKAEAAGAPGLSQSTLVNTYVSRIKTITRRPRCQ